MKNIFIILCVMSISIACSQQEKEDPSTKENNDYLKKGGWKLVWEDDFNRDDIFATKIWSKIWRCDKADWCKTMSQDPSLFEIKNGNLILLGKPSTNPAKDKSKYITGGVSTKDNYEPFVHHTVHSTYTQAGKKDPTKRTPKSTATAPINPDDYNIYAVELDTDELRFYVNGKQTFSYARVPEKESEGQFPFARPYMLRIDMQLGGSWVGEVKPFTKPVRMYVDWVRFYQK